MIAQSQQLLQLKQQQEQQKQQNALLDVFKNPDAVDKTTGLPTNDTLQAVTAINPQFGLQMRQNSLVQQDQQVRRQYFMSDMAAKNADRIAEAYAPIVENREERIKGGMPPPEADRMAQAEMSAAKENLTKSGMSPDLLKLAPDSWDPVKIPILVHNSTSLRDWQKDQLANQRLKDQEQTERQRGAIQESLPDHTPIIFRPNEPPGHEYTFAATGQPVPPDRLKDLTKITSSDGSAATQDRTAQVNVVKTAYEKELGHPVTTPEEKAELDKRVLDAEKQRKVDTAGAVAGAKQATTAKPIPVTIAGKPGDAIWKDGRWVNSDGSPIPAGTEVRLAPKPAAPGSANAQRQARFDEMKAAQQAAGTYKDDTGVWRNLDKQMAEDKQTAISDDAALLAAQVALKTGHPPAWMGRSQASLTKFLDVYAAEAKRQNLSADDIASNIAKFSGEMAEARTLGTSSARIDFAAKELEVALPTAMEASERVWRPGFKKLAELQQAIKGQASDPDLLEFAQFNQQVMSAYAAAMNRGGVSTVHAMERAESLLSTATSQAGYMRQLDTLHKEVQSILYGTQGAKDHLRAEITGSPEVTNPPKLTGVPRATPTWPSGTPIPDAAKADLKAHPDTATHYDEFFGTKENPNPSKEILGQKEPPAAIPQVPAGLPPTSQWSPSRKMWRDPSGKLYDASGKPVGG